LAAYVVSRGEVSVAALREHLGRIVPGYMIPAYIVKMEELPLTPNGKIDRKALPDPLALVTGPSSGYAAPGSWTEIKLANIWEEILGKKRVGAHDNFFELGGNSMKILRMVSMFRREVGTEISPIWVYQAPTVKGLAEYISASSLSPAPPVEEECLLLSPKRDRNIFCFPPFPGYSSVYREMAGYLKDYGVYGFNFLEDDSLIEKYAAMVKAFQKEGPCIFLGYSGGGNLAFEVAKAMAEKGDMVSDIIMIDTWKRERRVSLTGREFEEVCAPYLAVLVRKEDGGPKRLHIMKRMNRYLDYVDGTVNTGKVSSRIHLLKAGEEKGDAESSRKGLSMEWRGSTTGRFMSYEGCGSHEEMLGPSNIKANISIIGRIMESIAIWSP
ncbi:MAG: thioesterase domain-containing protein, partial [Dissulfurispiraceae bacterium]